MFFENSSLKGISGQNMSDPLKWSLTDDSRFLQAAVLKTSHIKSEQSGITLTTEIWQRQYIIAQLREN